ATPAPRLRRRHPPLPRPLRCAHRHVRRAAAAGPADAGRGMRGARDLVAGVGEHRCGVVPDPLPSHSGGLMLAITGSTGAVGGRVSRALADDLRTDLRLVVRDPSRAPDLDTDVRVCDYADHAAAVAA